jgi:Uncharacterized protein conserved in bacteria
MRDIKELAKGRWPGIMRALGIDIGKSGKHCACPVCKGRDRFRFDDKNGTGSWFCNQCQPQAGDGFALVMKVLKIDFKQAVKEIEKIISTCDVTKQQPEPAISRELLRKIYTESKPVQVGDPVSKYLKNRGINVLSEKLRYHPNLYEPETKRTMPAMLATFSLPDKTAITMHRTFLNVDGQKAKISNPKKILPALQKMSGGAIRLFEPQNGLIGVAEGIETALAVHEQTKLPIWSAVSSVLMESFEPPKEVTHVDIFADRDRTYTGQRAANILANRLVVQRHIEADVFVPKNIGDFLDEFRGGNEK